MGTTFGVSHTETALKKIKGAFESPFATSVLIWIDYARLLALILFGQEVLSFVTLEIVTCEISWPGKIRLLEREMNNRLLLDWRAWGWERAIGSAKDLKQGINFGLPEGEAQLHYMLTCCLCYRHQLDCFLKASWYEKSNLPWSFSI